MKFYTLEIKQGNGSIILRFPHDEIRGEILKLISKHKAACKEETLSVVIADKESAQY